MCDGYKLTTKRAVSKRGLLDAEMRTRYEAYIDRLKLAIEEKRAEYFHSELLRLNFRAGFSGAVKSGLELVTTTHVMVNAHRVLIFYF